MGRKQAPATKKGEGAPGVESKKEDVPEPEEEEPPIVKELKVLDDRYLEIERDYEKEVEELKKKYLDRKKPLLDDRQKVLIGDGEDKQEGTPKLTGFWRKAMANHPAFEELLQEWDEPVLDYLRNVEWEPSGDNSHCFKLTFTFTENPYFEPKVLVKEYTAVESSPYNQEVDVKKMECTEIEWKPGKDVTVEKTAKKVKGGGAKKAKQKGKEVIEPRQSVFRLFFRSLEEGKPLPDDLKNVIEMDEEDDDESDNEMVQMFLENDYETALALKDQVIPFAVRWYTGEAAPEDDDSDDEDEEEESDEDDEDDEDSEEDTPKKKGNAKKAGNKSKGSPKQKPAGDPPKEECKQQ